MGRGSCMGDSFSYIILSCPNPHMMRLGCLCMYITFAPPGVNALLRDRCSYVLSASTPVNNFHIIFKCGIGLKLDIAAPCSFLSLLVHFILWSSKLAQNSVASIHSAAVQFFLSLRWESSSNILAGHLGLEISNLAFFPIASQLINPLSVHC